MIGKKVPVSIKVDDITFNADFEPDEHTVWLVYWGDQDKTLYMMTDVTNVVLQIGQESLVKVRNNTGATINNGEAVYITGSLGNRPTIAKAKADAEATASVLGLVTEDIENNADGYCTAFGLVRDFDTSAFTEGDELWLSDATAGALTKVKPAIAMRIGWCTRDHANNGIVLVSLDKQF